MERLQPPASDVLQTTEQSDHGLPGLASQASEETALFQQLEKDVRDLEEEVVGLQFFQVPEVVWFVKTENDLG